MNARHPMVSFIHFLSNIFFMIKLILGFFILYDKERLTIG